MKNRNLIWLAGWAALTGWIAVKVYRATPPHSSRMITDVQGNYDLDGVSFDSDKQRVTVSGDATRADSITPNS